MNLQEQINKRGRHEAHKAELQLAAAHGGSDEGYRDEIKKCDQAAEQLDGFQSYITDIKRQIRDAVQHHAAVCEPLQEEMETADIARKIQLRVAINQANSDLEGTIEPLKKSLAAAESEIEFLRGRVGVRTAIENAFVANGPPEQKERVAVLHVVASWLGIPLSQWESKVRGCLISVEIAEEKRANGERVDLENLKQEHRHAQAILAQLKRFDKLCSDEIEAIRAERLKALYA